MYDVVIIGGGIIGCSIARELSRYKLKTCLLEKESDVCSATSKANSAIVHAGYDAKPGSLKAKMNVEGNAMFTEICEDLDIPFKRTGSIVVAFAEEEKKTLDYLYDHGVKNGVPGMKILNQDELRKLEPHINPKAVGALFASTGGVICPFTATIAFAENAASNGVEFKLDTEVSSIKVLGKENFIIKTNKGNIETRFIVNAAGVYADKVNDMVGAEPFKINPRKGEYCILDKDQLKYANTVIFEVPSLMGKGILVSPTVHGNLLIGPNAEDIQDKEDLTTTAKGLSQVMEGSKKSVPDFQLSKVITSFSGLRATPDTKDFIIRASKIIPGFVNAAGIESPGLSSAPAIAKMIGDILKEEGLKCEANPSFNPKRPKYVRFHSLDPKEQAEIVKKNPSYGKVICRCETVTEGEIIEAIHRPIPATSLDAIKRRVRPGMGRCQGGFCSPRVLEILSRELKIPFNKVTKFGKQSFILDSKMKDKSVSK